MMAARTYRRTAGTRILAALCLVLFVAATVSAASGAGATPGFFILLGLASIAALNVAAAFGDRITLDDCGIEVANPWLARTGRRARRVAWDDVASIREHHGLRPGGRDAAPRAIFLGVRAGRRLVLDSLEDFDEVIRTVRARTGQ
jgi:hypothetical protein